LFGRLASGLRSFIRPFRPLLRRLGRFAGDLFGVTPALIVGAGVFFIVFGLFSYFTPGSQADASPSGDIAAASPSLPLFSIVPSASPSGSGAVSPSPSGSGTAGRAIATRVVIPALNIDDPIIASPPNELYPMCDTAEYLTLDRVFAYPGAPQAVYIYAHARVGMFWNLLVRSKVNNGASMIGMWVEVYTDDNQRHIYEITKVMRHVPPSSSSLDLALSATTDQLWLQTSEGHANSSTKLQILAVPIGVIAATQADAHPASRAHVCPDAPFCTAAGQSGCRTH
jgi:hypothetical protein